MASRGGTGMIIDLDRVPRRETGMTPYEVMLSESQERMLLVPVPGREKEVREVLVKWGLEAVVVGEVTADGMVTLTEGGAVVAQVPAKALADDAPVYHRESSKPEYVERLAAFDTTGVPACTDPGGALLRLIGSPSVASKRWIWEQYDHQVGAGTVIGPGSDAAVVRLPGSRRGVALSTDCNSRYCYLNPRLGAAHAVAEGARNVACTGARPLAVTNCQNFGNPYKPEVFWQFREAIAGMSEACRALGTPVTGGNVSLANEDGETAIRPTPVIGMVGVMDDVELRVPMGFAAEGDIVMVLGATRDEIGASEYLAVVHGVEAGQVPALDLEAEGRLCRLLATAARDGLLRSAHDISEGGLAVALAECAIAGSIGATLRIGGDGGLAPDRFLFSESAARAVVTLEQSRLDEFLALAGGLSVPATTLGRVGGDRLCVELAGAVGTGTRAGAEAWRRLDVGVDALRAAYEEAIPCAMQG
jgi:phosphoribosylformylglycinamidine synthase